MISLLLNYMNIKGVVTEVNTSYRLLKVVKTIIPFDDIYSIELLAKGILFLLFNDITSCRPDMGRFALYKNQNVPRVTISVIRFIGEGHPRGHVKCT